MLELSQVILGVQDLDAATAAIAARGLQVLDGGRHPGLGTANRIVPLGRQYFELLSVVDRDEADRNPFGQALLRQIAQGDRLVRWSLRTDAIDQVAARLGLAVEPRARVRPDGGKLTWRAADLDLAQQLGWLPFFVAWDDPEQYPGLLPARHPNGAAGVAWLELATDDPARLARWTEGAEAPLRLVGGPPGLRRVALNTAQGESVLP